jgi:hypothetical protein
VLSLLDLGKSELSVRWSRANAQDNRDVYSRRRTRKLSNPSS